MYEINRRIALIIPAATGLASLPVKARAQSVGDLTEIFANVEGIFREVRISSPNELGPFFNTVWRLRTALSFAVVSDGAATALEDIVSEAEGRLREDTNGNMPLELSEQVKEAAVQFQSTAIAIGTDLDNGRVEINEATLFDALDFLCPLYPFC